MPKIVAFVPAKSSSERINNKNLTILDGEYLFKRKLRQLLACPMIDEVYLDTDSDEIAALAADLPILRLKRPHKLATNSTDGHELFEWECSTVNADIYIQTLCTAPFIDASTIERAIEQLLRTPKADSLVAITKEKQYLWENNNPIYLQNGRIPNSVDLPTSTIEAMSLYMVRGSEKRPRHRYGINPTLFEITPQEAIDINWPEDLLLGETIAAGIRAQENLRLSMLRPHLKTAMLSDITRELGLQCTLPHEISPRGLQRNLLGRAKTLLLIPADEKNHWKGIYNALESYDFVRPGDIIVVENRIPERAYFGNLNASLAIRAGASGAIIDGVTRDSAEVASLEFPVYSRGHYCRDIKFDGTVKSINMPIKIGEVSIKNDDYIIADHDGAVAIPQEHWQRVLQLAWETIEKEKIITTLVAKGISAKNIFKEMGAF
ncbi:cytidylyltransferase domain-containing protein [Delftia sp. WSY_9]|uniref:RraA family protein n=1 Tax=unclassified Delftia TaxID=2613839 RepID=UPI001E449C61|nr:dimethylmenaquinone methyltransferase [Delftia sp. Lp-1]MCB4789644.1 dimethylmenaquinone methyltransferase [Delftia sp. Lp-1]